LKPVGSNIKISDILLKIKEEWSDCRHIVITGGEPMMQKNLHLLVDALNQRDHIVTIETNGTIFNSDVKPQLFSISPKTNNSIPDDEKGKKLHLKNNRLEESIPQFIESDVEHQIKFVIEGHHDLDEISNFIEKYDIQNNNVFLMPEGITREVQRERELEIAEICKNLGFNFCPRLHIELWGTQRGV
jgi:7-carboxy-7-deazaguanine synthase